MSFRLFDAPEREASHFVGFAGNMIDRQSEKRSDDSAILALAEASSRIMLVRSGRIYLKSGPGGFDPWFSQGEAEAFEAGFGDAVLLGRDGRGAVLALSAGVEADALPEGFKAIDFRSVYTQGLIDAEALGALAQGAALVAWHVSHRFCGVCGNPTETRAGGYKRVCPSCKTEHFPRTDPVAIMLAVTPEKCLLGRSPRFPPTMYSCLAGFIEHGETIENAVRREILEESGIRIGRVVYHASQPWPFPYSLMIGCYGEALNDDIVPDTAELDDCRWFSRAEARQIVAGTHPDGVTMPPRMAIAHHLIKAWAESD